MWCDRCKINSTYIKKYEEEFTIKGKIIKVKSNRRFCKKCNKLVYDLELDEETICKAYKLYNEQYGIPCDKIKKRKTIRRNKIKYFRFYFIVFFFSKVIFI